MPSIIPIVEGPGDVEAVLILIRKILEANQLWNWSVGKPKKAGSLTKLKNNLRGFLEIARVDRDCGGILILLDLDDGCPRTEALALAQAARQESLDVPTAIVLAHREYEAWLLASLPTIAGSYSLPPDLHFEGNVEDIRGAKEWLQKEMPPGKAYKETFHQAKLTAQIDLETAKQHSRSFRRLCHAVEELVHNADQQQRGVATP